jgi:putative tryptophan/tyrosine transport system substrate-binding protein
MARPEPWGVAMRRRDFITLLGGAALIWPLEARSQQGERIRRIGWLAGGLAATDPESQARKAAFLQRLRELGWTEGHNVRIDYRWGADSADTIRKQAAELIALAPDVTLAIAGQAAYALQQESRTIPMVFTQVTDPIGAGIVDSLARPGGNATGFTTFEYGFGAKWLELLKQIAPGVKRVAVLRDPTNPAGSGQWGAIQSAASSAGVELISISSRRATDEIERDIAAFARQPNGGLIMTGSTTAASRRDALVTLITRQKLPAIYPYRYYSASGGLFSYGPDTVDQYRRAAGYVDRILKGEKSADLPVQTPTKFELVINLKTAKALDLTVPPSLLAQANEVIE